MPQSLFRLCGHLVYSTKNHHPFLAEPYRDRMHGYLAEHLRAVDCEAVNVGGTEDHVHLAFVLPKLTAPADMVKDLKSASSVWAKTLSPDLTDFAWQRGYSFFSICPADFDVAVHYVKNQAEHHKTLSFQDEYRRFLKKYRIDYDERYVWD